MNTTIVHVQNGDRMRATYGCLFVPNGVCCRPCIADACTARVCLADQVVFTEMSRAGGGSDPCEGRAPSRVEDGCILTSAAGCETATSSMVHVSRGWRKSERRCGVRSTTWLQSCGSLPTLRKAFHALYDMPLRFPSVGRFRPLFSIFAFRPGHAFNSHTSGPTPCHTKQRKKHKNGLSANKS